MGAMENEQTTPETYIDGQIAKLKEQGVTFGICAEAEARDYLAEKCPPCKTCSYARLFDTYSEGESEGKYIELDFGQLRYLADIDQRLREILLNMTLDVEHFCKTKLMTMCAVTEEEGRAIISQYMGSLDGERRQRIESELARHDGHSCGEPSNGGFGFYEALDGGVQASRIVSTSKPKGFTGQDCESGLAPVFLYGDAA